jgi:hypothetical protein
MRSADNILKRVKKIRRRARDPSRQPQENAVLRTNDALARMMLPVRRDAATVELAPAACRGLRASAGEQSSRRQCLRSIPVGGASVAGQREEPSDY